MKDLQNKGTTGRITSTEETAGTSHMTTRGKRGRVGTKTSKTVSAFNPEDVQ